MAKAIVAKPASTSPEINLKASRAIQGTVLRLLEIQKLRPGMADLIHKTIRMTHGGMIKRAGPEKRPAIDRVARRNEVHENLDFVLTRAPKKLQGAMELVVLSFYRAVKRVEEKGNPHGNDLPRQVLAESEIEIVHRPELERKRKNIRKAATK